MGEAERGYGQVGVPMHDEAIAGEARQDCLPTSRRAHCSTPTSRRRRRSGEPGPPTTSPHCGSRWRTACPPTCWRVALIALGMNWWQALLTIALGNVIVLVPILLNAHPGTKYGIPFPVLARSSFGTIGRTFPRSCGRSWPVGGSAFRPTSAARRCAPSWLRGGRASPESGRPRDPGSQRAQRHHVRHLLADQHRHHRSSA